MNDSTDSFKLDQGPVRRIQKYKPTPADQRFRQRIKQERGLCCEACGKKPQPEALGVHHIFPFRIYPEFARVADNVLVLCIKCHQIATRGEGSCTPELACFYATLPAVVRSRHLPFLKRNSASQSILDAFKRGDSDHWNTMAVRAITR